MTRLISTYDGETPSGGFLAQEVEKIAEREARRQGRTLTDEQLHDAMNHVIATPGLFEEARENAKRRAEQKEESEKDKLYRIARWLRDHHKGTDQTYHDHGEVRPCSDARHDFLRKLGEFSYLDDSTFGTASIVPGMTVANKDGVFCACCRTRLWGIGVPVQLQTTDYGVI